MGEKTCRSIPTAKTARKKKMRSIQVCPLRPAHTHAGTWPWDGTRDVATDTKGRGRPLSQPGRPR